VREIVKTSKVATKEAIGDPIGCFVFGLLLFVFCAFGVVFLFFFGCFFLVVVVCFFGGVVFCF
jgi:hypothetical protein